MRLRLCYYLLSLGLLLASAGAAPFSDVPANSAPAPAVEKSEMPALRIQIGPRVFAATLADNPSSRALVERLPMTVTMGELNGNEKYYYLPDGLPADDERPGQIQNGDLMLYGSDCLVLFYESFSSSYRYIRLGKVDDPDGLAAALGSGSVEVTFGMG